ncbi:MAG TPA: DUF1080 domain-containing protein, partial [Armatimonadetes bacterium]|nr:DUF1080 domain-containing protein [Armatimonadota bacterium]
DFLVFDERPDSIYVKGVKVGDTISVGKFDPSVEPLDISVPNSYRPFEGRFVNRFGFTIVNLAPYANERVSLDWSDTGSNAGLHGGLLFAFGVPVFILPPEGEVCVKGGTIPLSGLDAKWLFLLVERRGEGAIEALYIDGRRERVDLDKGAPAFSGWPPVYGWSIDIVPFKVRGELRQINVKGEVRLYGITAVGTPQEKIEAILERIERKRREVLVERRLRERLERELGPLFERASGRIAVLPLPLTSMRALRPFGRFMMHIQILKDPSQFDPEKFWVALYLGGEQYYRALKRPLLQFLKAGGTLVVLPTGPFPFYYDEREMAVNEAHLFGLPIRMGWEKPPEGLKLTFHVNPDQRVVTSLPREIPWTEEIWDPRWRPIGPPKVEGAVYTPIITLRDWAGNSYGDAASMIEYRKGPLAPGRVIYVWQGLLRLPEVGDRIVVDVLKFVLSQKPPVSKAVVVRATGRIEVDGVLDEPDWKFAPALELVRTDGTRAKHRTVARLLWDDRNLYIAFECEDPDIWAKYTEFDSPHWEADIVEVFVDPDGDGRNYKEFGVAPNGAADDLNIPSVGGVRDWRENAKWNAKGWVYKVRVEGTLDNRADRDKGWTVEMAIPLSNFADQASIPPKAGDTWRLNLYRIDRSGKEGQELLCLSPTFGGFHAPDRFARVAFASSLASEDFSLYLEGSDGWPTWRVMAGEWAVKGGVFVGKNCTTRKSDAWTAVGAVGGLKEWKDYELSLRFRIRSRGSDWRDGAWIGFRYLDTDNCYTLCIHDKGLYLHKVSEGVSTGDQNPLAHSPWSPDDKWHSLRITVKGQYIVVSLDGKRVIEVVDEDWNGVPPILRGGICLCARRFSGSEGETIVEFDDIKVRHLGR